MVRMDDLRKRIDWDRVDLFLKIGILGATMILIGDMAMGWGVKDTSIPGLKGEVAQYLLVADWRMVLSAHLGVLGVPLAALGHYGIYKMFRPYTEKYARLYLIGGLGFLAFGGAGVHMTSVEAAYFYKYMTVADPSLAWPASVNFALYFMLPLYILLIVCWLLLLYSHARAVLSKASPYPRWTLIFSMLVGTLIFNLLGLLGNHPLINALVMGAASLGNIWCLAGQLWLARRARERLG